MKILSRLLLILLTTSTYAQIAGSAMTLHFNSTNHVPGAGVIDCGGTRLHDADSWAWWVVQSRGPTSFNWGGLDTFLADVYTACGGAVPTIYQLGGSPSWAPSVSNPAPACAQDMNGVNGCYPPSDLNADGTGTNLIWRNWVAAAGTHLNAAGYTSNHAHVQYLEPWNEVDNSCILNPVINDGRCASNFWEGTYAQLMRMTQDLRCIWEGDTSMTVGATGETCAQVRSKVTSVRLSGPIDPTALILVPSSHLTYGSYGNGSTNVSQNLLYCNNSPKAGSQCTNGGMHAAVDILNEHIKPCNTTCDLTSNFVENNITTNVSNWKSFLQTAELAKPLWITEGGFSGIGPGWPTSGVYDYTLMEESFIPRYFAIAQYSGVSLIAWYNYDTNDALMGNSTLTQGWNTTYNWLVGKTLNGCNLTNHLWTCNLTSGTTHYILAWQNNQSCTTSCNTVSTVVPNSCTQYTDISGTVHRGVAGTVNLGIMPILLQPCTTSDAMPSAPRNRTSSVQ